MLSRGQVLYLRLEAEGVRLLPLASRRAIAKQIESSPEIDAVRGAPVYRGTRIPVDLIADMLSQGATPEEILAGYPALDREKVELAPLYVQAFPRRGRPALRPWAKRKPIRATRPGRAFVG